MKCKFLTGIIFALFSSSYVHAESYTIPDNSLSITLPSNVKLKEEVKNERGWRGVFELTNAEFPTHLFISDEQVSFEEFISEERKQGKESGQDIKETSYELGNGKKGIEFLNKTPGRDLLYYFVFPSGVENKTITINFMGSKIADPKNLMEVAYREIIKSISYLNK